LAHFATSGIPQWVPGFLGCSMPEPRRLAEVRKQKTDERDARLILKSLAHEKLLQDLDSHTGRTRLAAVTLASAQAGLPAHDVGQPAARAGAERGTLPQEEAVHEERSRRAGWFGAGSVGLPALRQYAQVVLPGDGFLVAGYTEASRGCKHLCRHCPLCRFLCVLPDYVEPVWEPCEIGQIQCWI
jgi:hypothetical protein